IAAIREALAVLHDAVDGHRRLQVDLHLLAGTHDAISDAVPAADGAIARADPHVEVVERHVPPAAEWRVRAAQRVGARERRALLRRRYGSEKGDEDEGTAHVRSNTE